MLVVAQGRTLAGRADRHQAVRALRDLPLHEIAKRLLVDRPVFERGDQGGEGAAEAGLGGHDTTISKTIRPTINNVKARTRKARAKLTNVIIYKKTKLRRPRPNLEG